MLSSWRTWPKVNVRRNVPNVDGAWTPVNNRSIPPCRSKSMSSMQSAPATNSARPHRCARATTGASPQHDTRFGSSNTADTRPAA